MYFIFLPTTFTHLVSKNLTNSKKKKTKGIAAKKSCNSDSKLCSTSCLSVSKDHSPIDSNITVACVSRNTGSKGVTGDIGSIEENTNLDEESNR